MVFNADGSKLAVASDKGTVHIFDTVELQKEALPRLFKQILPKYFYSNWSFVQLRMREGKCAIAFVPDQPNAIAVVRHDGLYYKYVFDEGRGGEAVMVHSRALL